MTGYTTVLTTCSQTNPQRTSLAIARCFSGTDPGIGGYYYYYYYYWWLLLLLGDGWRVRNTITPTTVGSQRCGAIGVLGEEIGPHNATAAGTSFAEDHRAYPVPFVCSWPTAVCMVVPHHTSPRHYT